MSKFKVGSVVQARRVKWNADLEGKVGVIVRQATRCSYLAWVVKFFDGTDHGSNDDGSVPYEFTFEPEEMDLLSHADLT